MRRPVPEKYYYYIIYKPYGYLSQFVSEQPKKKMLGLLYDFPPEVHPVGRLDEDSEGLLLLTNNGALHKNLLAHHVEKEYWMIVEGEVTEESIRQLSEGVTISIESKPYQTKPCKAKLLKHVTLPERVPATRYRAGKPFSWISVTLTEGKNRQVRRMCAAAGHPVLRLIRTRIGGIEMNEQMKPGEVKQLTYAEVVEAGLFNSAQQHS